MEYGLAEYAVNLARRHGADYAEALLEHSISVSQGSDQGVPNGSTSIKTNGIRVRIVKAKRLYTFSTNELDKSAISDMVAGARPFTGSDISLSREKRAKAKSFIREKRVVREEDMESDITEMDRSLSKIKWIKYRSIYATFGRTMRYFTNSDGSDIETSTPFVDAYASITVGSGRRSRETMAQAGCVGGYESFDVEAFSDDVMERAKGIKKVIDRGIEMKPAEISAIKNVVVSPEIVGIAAHESVGHPCEADRVFGREAAQAGTSYITKDNLRMSVGSKAVTIIDDPTLQEKSGFYMYDDEGIKSAPKVLIEKGRQKELLLDRNYAHVLGMKSNGSSRSSSYSNEPLIRMSNTYMKKGRASFDELIEEAHSGVYIKSFAEWNIDDTRTFSRYQGNEAYLIKNGELSRPVVNYRLEKPTLEFWHAVSMVANDLEFYVGECGKGEPTQGIPVTMGGPSALLTFS